ncbi:MAG TPA: microviridin/marinostatin family tricyclic proteinase inhibitor [Thermoanaerobaculia bacterium]|nr:microviridin/marinostatin family tricyclic proteinase inhibitor [Thermoanaerobaculia bacterium]
MQKKPFFARFLEIQEPEQVKTAVQAGGGGGKQTLKYPTDNEEGDGGGL